MENARKRVTGLLLSVILVVSLLWVQPMNILAAGQTPVSKNGRLSVKNTRLVNEQGKTVILKGVSTHGINWFPQYINTNAFRTLRDEWGVNCIRLAMYTEEYNGYCSGGNKE